MIYRTTVEPEGYSPTAINRGPLNHPVNNHNGEERTAICPDCQQSILEAEHEPANNNIFARSHDWTFSVIKWIFIGTILLLLTIILFKEIIAQVII